MGTVNKFHITERELQQQFDKQALSLLPESNMELRWCP
jgi:hypothetical protein